MEIGEALLKDVLISLNCRTRCNFSAIGPLIILLDARSHQQLPRLTEAVDHELLVKFIDKKLYASVSRDFCQPVIWYSHSD